MANAGENSKWLTLSITLAVATFSATAAAISFHIWSRKSRFDVEEKVRELEIALKSSVDKCIAERQGRIRAQQALRKALVQTKCENLEWVSYPMAPIAVVRSCFSTRNGTPRQPLLVPLARANLLFHTARVPPASLEGLQEYSHCWIIYVFHMNTNLEKLWKHPSASKFKAKVRVPKLKGGRLGVFATRSPHRPCPIGLTVAKVEAVQGNMVQLSGVDLVDGTPVLDIKPYIPYCDSNETATVPSWVKEDSLLTTTSVNFADGFSNTLANCWRNVAKKSLYASPDEFRSLIKEVLSWDIRSLSQRTRPHNSVMNTENGTRDEQECLDPGTDDEGATNDGSEGASLPSGDVIYHLILEGLDVSYKIDCDDNILVEAVSIPSQSPSTSQHHQKS